MVACVFAYQVLSRACLAIFYFAIMTNILSYCWPCPCFTWFTQWFYNYNSTWNYNAVVRVCLRSKIKLQTTCFQVRKKNTSMNIPANLFLLFIFVFRVSKFKLICHNKIKDRCCCLYSIRPKPDSWENVPPCCQWIFDYSGKMYNHGHSTSPL